MGKGNMYATIKQKTAVQITSTNHQSGQKIELSVPQETTGETDCSTFFTPKS